jgi:hypothetical protein
MTLDTLMVRLKTQFALQQAIRTPEWEQKYSSNLSLTSALDGGGWSTPRPSRFTLGKEARYRLHTKASGPAWAGTENLTLTGTRHPDRPAHADYAIPLQWCQTSKSNLAWKLYVV